MSGYRPPVLLGANSLAGGDGPAGPWNRHHQGVRCVSRRSASRGGLLRLVHGERGYPQPVALLARLGVDQRHEGQGLGAALLADVITRVASISDAIGCRALLVHAESEQARGFYEHLIPEFQRSPTDPLHLVLLLKHIRRTLKAFGT
jgi:GNAT superfamily N-acetyltransferase